MQKPVVEVQKLHKRFKLYTNPWYRGLEWLGFGKRHTEKTVLSNISFDVRRGEILGIIGRNGAGKTTLLKILSGTLQSTSGQFAINGRVLSLFSLGTGFNAELTGRQNLYHSALALGFPQSYVDSRLSQIEEFSELGDYFERPFKFYSAGMRARLGFSLFAFLECDVLILDEVLSVGDLFFRQKCYARLDQLIANGTSIVLVTHSMSTVQQYCHRVMVLEKGNVHFLGNAGEAIDQYTRLQRNPTHQNRQMASSVMPAKNEVDTTHQSSWGNMPNWPSEESFIDLNSAQIGGGNAVRCTGISLCREDNHAAHLFEQGTWLSIFAQFELHQDIGIPIFAYTLVDERNVTISGEASLHQLWPKEIPAGRKGEQLKFQQKIKLDLRPGSYALKVSLSTIPAEVYQQADKIEPAELRRKMVYLIHLEQFALVTIIQRQVGFPLVHHGICHLPSNIEAMCYNPRLNPQDD